MHLSLFIFNNKITDIIYKNNEKSITSARYTLDCKNNSNKRKTIFFGWGYQINEYSYIDKYLNLINLKKVIQY